ncbi:hypothetical protein JCM10207_006817 [Rhodosporidiobolus poonsookiae]
MRSLFLTAAGFALAALLYSQYSTDMSPAPAQHQRTQLALFGTPIEHSLSPLFHNTVYETLSLPHRYDLHESASFPPPADLSFLRSPSFCGAAVTMPHKVAALSTMDVLAPEVDEVGSMNTVVVQEDGRLLGRNTDTEGIRMALLSTLGEEERRREAPFGEGRSAIIIGGGGTTRAAIYALSSLRLSPLYLINRDASETASIIATPAFAKYDLRALDDAALASWTEEDFGKVACGVGAIPSFEPQTEGEKMVYRVAEGVFERSGKMEGRRPLMEMAYKPHITLMYKLAQSHGWHPIGGIEALIHQAAAQDRYWLLDSPATRIEGLTAQELERAVQVAAAKVREAAGAPGV